MIDPTPAHGKTLRVSVIELPREESERRPCVPRTKSVAIEPNATCSLVLLDHRLRIRLEGERVPKVTVGVSNPSLGEVERTNDPLALLGEACVVVGEVVVKQNWRENLRVDPRCNPEQILEQTSPLG